MLDTATIAGEIPPVAYAPAPPALPWLAAGEFPLYLAPMAGFTDSPFRRLCKQQGADVLVTEFVNAEGLVRGNEIVWQDLHFTPAERPLGAQIFGGDPVLMAEAARRIAARLRPDFIDLNFGCPAPKITCRNAGSSLLRDLPLLEKVARAVVDAVRPTPVTAKIRLGWDEFSIVALDAARRLEDAGVRALAVHGRTKEQGYRGEADWDVIASVAAAVTIPIIGNGGVDTPAMAARLRRDTRVAGLMIGRAALGNPWIFRELRATLAGLPPPSPPHLTERWDAILRYADDRLAGEGKDPATAWLGGYRAALKTFTKDLPDAAALRAAFEKVCHRAELHALAASHLGRWAQA